MKQMIKKALACLLAFIMTFSLSFTLLPATALAADAVLDPVSADFDKNPANQEDVSTIISWNDATSVTDVKAGVVSIGTENYSYSGDTLTIKKEYLASQTEDELVLTIEFDTGDPATLTIDIGDSTPVSAVIDPVSATFDKNPANQADLNTTVTWNSATSVTDVKAGVVSIGAENYSYSGNTLTIKKEYLALQATSELALTIEFDKGNTAVLTVTVSDTTPVSAAIDPVSAVFDKNPANQADVSTTVTWHDTSSVTDVKTGGTSIGTDNYSVSENTLIIKKEYLVLQADGELILTIEFNTGSPATLTVTVCDTTPVSAVIDPVSAVFDKNPEEQADINASVTWNDASSVSDVKAGGTSIGTDNYSVSENTLTIKKEYLALQADGELILTVEFDIGEPATLTIAVSDTTPVCEIETTRYHLLGEALASIGDGETKTIKLLTDIEYNAGIAVSGKSVTFDLSGHNLNVNNDTGIGLEVGSGGVVDITGSGELNVVSSAIGSYGVYAHDGGRAVVTSAAAGDCGFCAYSQGTGSRIEVKGSAIAKGDWSYGLFAVDGGQVSVGGDVRGSFIGVQAGNGSQVEISGDVVSGEYGYAVIADAGSTVSVTGSVISQNDGVYLSGLGSMVFVGGGVNAGATGVCLYDGSTATIEGTVTAQTDIVLQGVIKDADGAPGDAPYEKYLVYSDGSNTARVNTNAVCWIGATPYQTLEDALAGVGSGEAKTIRLISNIDYNKGISINGRAITFDLSGHTLSVNNDTGSGLNVGSGGVVDITGSGALNVTTGGESSYGVYAYNGGQAKITSATAVGVNSRGVCAQGTGSRIEVTGSAIATGSGSYGALAADGGQVIVGGNAEGSYTGALAAAGSRIEVSGDVILTGYGYGAMADGMSTVDVTGNVNCQDGIGVYASVSSTVFVGGSVNSGSIGVCAFDAGMASIEGSITAPTYIMLQNTAKTAADGEAGQAPYEKYLVYSDGSNTVRVNTNAVCWIGSAPYQTLEGALAAVGSGQTKTIRLISDIDYSKGISVSGRNITFDLNGHTLGVTNNGGYGLDVGSGGIVGITGSGALNVTSTGSYKYGVYVHDGGRAKVTSAAATGVSSRGAYAQGTNSRIEVTGNATADGIGACANNGGRVIIGGDAKGGNAGAEALYSGVVEVSGNAELTGVSGYAIFVYEGGTVRVTGNANGGNSYGISAYGANSTAVVGGSVTAGTGVLASDGSKATVEGTITAPTYIVLQNAVKTAGDGEPGQAPYEKYLVYTDGSNTVRVNTNAVCWIGSAPYQTLDAALTAVGSGEQKTIRLISNIDYIGCITVTGRAITFDLSGHTLIVTNNEGHGLDVGSGGVLDYTGSGAFNVTSNNSGSCGVYAHDGGKAKVTNATAGMGSGICSDGVGSFIDVKGNVSAGTVGVQTLDGGTAIIEGAITAPTYVILQGAAKIPADGEPGQAPYEKYLVYTDGSNIVRVNTNAVCWISSSPYQTLDAALAAVGSNEVKTIRLISNINYNNGIAVTGRSITFDLSGHTLSVVNNSGHALEAGSGGIVDTMGSGAFNVTSGASNKYGVYAHDGGRVKVTSAVSTMGGYGVYSDGTGSNIEVTGSATASGGGSTGAAALNGGKVSVGVDAEGSHIGAAALYGGLTEVSGSVKCTGENGYAVYSNEGGIVRVTGGASSGNGIGIYVNGSGCEASVGGDVTAGTVGIQAYSGGKASVNGTLTAPTYISLGSESAAVVKTAYDGVPGIGEHTGYLVYTDESSTVFIKNPVSPANVDFDRNPACQADVSTTITWNDAASVTDVKISGASIGTENYSVAGNTLTIRKEYLAPFAPGELVLTVEFNTGAPAKLAVAVRDTTIYTVSLNAAGGSVAPWTMQATYGFAYGDLPTPVRTGYYFYGWYTAAGSRVEKTDIFSFTDNITLHARWIKNTLLALSAPSLAAKGTSYETITLTWKAVKGAEEYQIYRWFDSIKRYDLIDTVKGLSFTDTELEKGVTYYYRIRARHYPYYDPVDSKYTYVNAKPAWPGISVKTAYTYNSIKLTWNKVDGATAYEVQRYNKVSGKYEPITSESTVFDYSADNKFVSYTDGGLVKGTKYYYKVRAYAASDPGILSSSRYATTGWPGISLKTVYTYNSIKLTWNKVDGATAYEVQRYNKVSGKYEPITSESTVFDYSADNKFVNYTDGGLVKGTKYYYKVRAYAASDPGILSSSRYATTGWPGISVKTAYTYNSIKLTWNKVDGATAYEVQRYNKISGKYEPITSESTVFDYSADNKFVTYTDGGLTKGTKYYYKVRAYDTASSDTGILSGYKYAIPAWPAVSFTVSSASYNSILIKWNTVVGADKYEVQRCEKYNGKYVPIPGAEELTTTSYTDIGRATGKTYYYKVRAYVSDTEYKLSGYKYAIAVPSAPAIAAPLRTSAVSISVSWDAVAEASGYAVYRATSLNGTYTLIKTTDKLTHEDTGLYASKYYYYKVRAYIKVGIIKIYGPYSEKKYA